MNKSFLELKRKIQHTEGFAAFTLPDLISQESYESNEFDSCGFSAKKLHQLKFENCIFKKTDFSQSIFHASKYIATLFESVNLANVRFSDCYFNQVNIIESRATGMAITNLSAVDFYMSDTFAQLIQLRFSNVKSSVFHRCDFTNADFSFSDLSGTIFSECLLKETDFSGTKLKDVDFSTSVLDHMKIGIPEIKGAIFSPTQVSSLISLLDVQIKDERPI